MKLKSWICAVALMASGYAAAAGETPAPADADNTGRNKVKETTAQDQSNAKADVELVAKLRKAVLADESLSVNAHNIKIVTRDGAVHLDGPVDSAAEKKKVEDIVRKNAGTMKVESAIDVEAK